MSTFCGSALFNPFCVWRGKNTRNKSILHLFMSDIIWYNGTLFPFLFEQPSKNIEDQKYFLENFAWGNFCEVFNFKL